MSDSRYGSLREFYPVYLAEHRNRTCRRLHFAGTSVGLALLVMAFATGAWWLVLVGFVQGYAFAWLGHFFFERNKPATFRHPWLSLLGDWRMWWDIVNGRMPL